MARSIGAAELHPSTFPNPDPDPDPDPDPNPDPNPNANPNPNPNQVLARQIAPLLAAAPTPAALAAAAAPSRPRHEERTGEGGYPADAGASERVGQPMRWADIPPLVRAPPCLLGASRTGGVIADQRGRTGTELVDAG